MVSLMLSFLSLAQAQWSQVPYLTPEQKYELCVQDCVNIHERPGYGLKMCLKECERRYLVFDPNDPRVQRPQACETYEDDCTRGDTGI
ncbi:MAG: hypothetical protein N2Z70_03650 [Bdellovibrionaceae bacterium]|jgi:hypothetical protein|nr:hypothetical protein [Pseudobdellovibrionaceae bacterium]